MLRLCDRGEGEASHKSKCVRKNPFDFTESKGFDCLFCKRFTAEHKGRDEIEGDDMKGDIENREAHRRVHRFHKLWVDVIDGKVCMQEDNPFRKLRFPSDKKTADDT